MANPVFNEQTFSTQYMDATGQMTYGGVAGKSLFLLLLLVLSAAFTWKQFAIENINYVFVATIISLIVGLILVFVISFKPKTAPILSPVVLGGISAYFEQEFTGIVIQAVLGTFAALFSLLALYASRVIKVTDKLRTTIILATLSIGVLYLAELILALFHINIPYINDSGAIGIAFSIIVVLIAVSNFLLDFDAIEKGVEGFAPKFMEWYSAFGLLVALVWVYLEILRLLAKFARRR